MKLLVLVVDDEPDVELLFRQQFRHDLRAGRFTMEFAQSGEMALQRFAEAFAETGDITCVAFGRPVSDKPDHRHRRLLRTRRKRPCRHRTADKRDELAPSHRRPDHAADTRVELAAVRGRMMRNSVNSPGSVSTSIKPPCCFTTMS